MSTQNLRSYLESGIPGTLEKAALKDVLDHIENVGVTTNSRLELTPGHPNPARAWESIANSINVALEKELKLTERLTRERNEAIAALKLYLNAGHKDARRYAAHRAIFAITQIEGIITKDENGKII